MIKYRGDIPALDIAERKIAAATAAGFRADKVKI